MKKRRKFTERIIAYVLVALMVVGAVPVDFVGVGAKEVKATENDSFSFDVPTELAKIDNMTDGVVVGTLEGFKEDTLFCGMFKVCNGGGTKGWKSKLSNGEYLIQTQSADNYLEFTIQANKKAKVSYTLDATGGDKAVTVGLKKDGETNLVGEVTSYGSGASKKVTGTVDVASGTYKLYGKKPTNCDGYTASANFRLYSISVVVSDADSLDELTAPEVTVTPGDSKLTVKWDKVDTATSYKLVVKNGSTEVLNETVTESLENYSKEVTGLTNGTEYSCTITAVRSQDNAEKSTTVNGTPITVGSGYRYVDIDLTSGLTTGIKYGAADVATVEVLGNMTYDATKGTTIDGVTYGGAIQGSANPTPGSGAIPTSGAAFKIEAIRDAKITFVTKSASKTFYFITSDGAVVSQGNSIKTGSNEFEIEAGKTYYYYASGSKIVACAINIKAGEPTINWGNVDVPSLTADTDSSNAGKIAVNYTASIGSAENGVAGEYLEVEVYSGTEATGSPVATLISRAQGESGTLSYSPTASGSYTFKPVLKRTDYSDKEGTPVTISFTLPLAAPVVTATSQGGGVIKVEWEAVPEATSYEVYVDGTPKGTTSETYMDISGLTAGQEYTFKVKALRGSDSSDFSEEKKETATASAKIKWESSVFGNGADAAKATITENNIDLGNDYESSVTIVAGRKDANGKFNSNCGKLQTTGTDGLVFYYTAVPTDTNFTLSATAHVNQWRYSNGQEGFGLMAADKVFSGAGDFWYNSYMADVTKVEYYYDSEAGKISNIGDKISMKLGVGAQEKIGVTAANQANFSVANDLKYTMSPLDISCATKGAGTYNMVANIEDASQLSNTVSSPNITADFDLTIQKNNTGYFISYKDKNGNTTTKKFYDPEALNKQDSEYVYVGFFASRYADITFKNVSLTTIKAIEDSPAEERPIEYINPDCKVISESTSNGVEYNFVYYANADGKLTVVDSANSKLVDNEDVTHGVNFEKKITLDKGDNVYTVTFTPKADYKPDNDPYKALSSYDPINETFTVAFNSFSGEDGKIYVSPAGKNTGDGTQANPLDIYTAVKYVQPGQTIVLKGGTYKLSSTVTIPRGTDGTADKKISMIADDSGTRPVLDFGGKCAGMIFAGNYWYVKGFDVTNSANGQKGIQISGSYSTFEQLNTYYNGNTGIQVSRYLGTDEFAQWPSYDTILNCTSYCNADSGFEDADGFAAKLTVGNGIVFDGCISHHNADDGWDLFAKVATGSIGTVTIKNSIAYANGWWINRSGAVVDAGNGNGFKMGGDSLSGKHILINSVAYDNKAKGIDSNSCPDIRVQNCTSYNNGSYNVALYTNSASNTDFEVTGLASFRTGTNVKEQLSFKGTQDNSKVYKTVNYFWDETAQISKNSDGEQCTAEWFMSTDTRITPTRNADGSIDMHSLLVLTDKAKQGAVINTSENTGKPNISEDSGNNGGNNSGGSSDNSGSTDDSDDYDSSDDSDVSSSDTSDSGSSSTDKKDNTISTIQGTEFVTNNGINNSAAGIVTSVKTDGTVSENITVVNDNASLQTEINNKIEKTAEKTISVFASDETVISADTMKSLATSGKTLSVGVVNEDGKVEAVITIDGTKIKGTPVDFTLEVNTGINAGSNATNIVNITNGRGISTDSVNIVDFTYSGNLPGEFKATVYVADRFNDGTRLAVFYYNPVTGQLENQYQLATVTKGYAEFSFNHCSSYVFIEESALSSTITTSALGSPKTADSNAIIFWLMLMCAAVLVIFGIQASRADGKKRA